MSLLKQGYLLFLCFSHVEGVFEISSSMNRLTQLNAPGMNACN